MSVSFERLLVAWSLHVFSLVSPASLVAPQWRRSEGEVVA